MGVVAAALRLPRLADPHKLVFDETYYVKQGYTLLKTGFENKWPDKSDELFTSGSADVFLDQADFPVHPPIGKWMIASGEWLFGIDSSFGWRFGAAMCGILMVVMITRVATRLFRSTLLGGLAGLFLAIDGHHIVHSRTSLLDIFVAFWALAAFCALVVDRDHYRYQLAKLLAAGKSPHTLVWWRPWRVLAAVSLGLTIGTKWSGLYFLAVFGILTVLWDYGARKAAGSRQPFLRGFWLDGVVAFFVMVPLAIVVYIASWFGWIKSSDAYLRQWGAQNPVVGNPLPDWFRSLWHYHEKMLEFHVGLSSPHTYQSNPWAWIIQWRPTSFFYESPQPAEAACGASQCSQAILSLGNIAIWWGGGIALFVAAFYWIFGRDWRAGAVFSGIIAGYFPWFMYQSRTIYAFYAVAFEAFLVLCLVYALGKVLGSSDATVMRRRIGVAVVGVFTLVALAVSWYFHPIIVGETIPYQSWLSRMWFKSWI